MSKSKYLVELLAKSRLIGNKIDIIPVDLRPANEEEAYLIQDDLHRHLFDKKYGEIIGHKIGCTTKVMQEYLGISNPCVGGVYDVNVNYYEGNYKFNKFISPGVECEIAVFLGKDLPPQNQLYNKNSVQEAVSDVMASIEIVDDRWFDYKSIDTLSLISDDFFASGCVLGKKIKLDKIKLPEISGRMLINDELVGTGYGKDMMGDPLEALAWLANFMSKRGKTLKANQFVSLGSIVETKWVNLGDSVHIEIDGLGSAIANFI